MKESTRRFFEMMNDQNEKVAALEPKEEPNKSVGLDPIRVQRERERREKFGTFRARTVLEHE